MSKFLHPIAKINHILLSLLLLLEIKLKILEFAN